MQPLDRVPSSPGAWWAVWGQAGPGHFAGSDGGVCRLPAGAQVLCGKQQGRPRAAAAHCPCAHGRGRFCWEPGVASGGGRSAAPWAPHLGSCSREGAVCLRARVPAASCREPGQWTTAGAALGPGPLVPPGVWLGRCRLCPLRQGGRCLLS